jgi:hypothetical protein
MPEPLLDYSCILVDGESLLIAEDRIVMPCLITFNYSACVVLTGASARTYTRTLMYFGLNTSYRNARLLFI